MKYTQLIFTGMLFCVVHVNFIKAMYHKPKQKRTTEIIYRHPPGNYVAQVSPRGSTLFIKRNSQNKINKIPIPVNQDIQSVPQDRLKNENDSTNTKSDKKS